MRSKLSPTEMRDLDRSMAAELGATGGSLLIRVFDAQLKYLGAVGDHRETVLGVANMVIIPSGKFLAEPSAPRIARGRDRFAFPTKPPELIDAPPSPHGEPISIDPTPVEMPLPVPAKPKPGDPGYQRHLHDDDFRRRYGIQ